MSLNLTDMVDSHRFTSNTSKIITYYTQIQHYENILHPLLDKEYYDLKKKHIELPNLRTLDNRAPSSALNYFRALSKWIKLIQVFAYNNSLLKVDIKRDKEDDIGGLLEEDTENNQET